MVFAEMSIWKLREKGPARETLGKLEPSWKRGIFLGFMKQTNGYITWGEAVNRVATSRTVHRLFRGARYDGEAKQSLRKKVLMMEKNMKGQCTGQDEFPAMLRKRIEAARKLQIF